MKVERCQLNQKRPTLFGVHNNNINIKTKKRNLITLYEHFESTVNMFYSTLIFETNYEYLARHFNLKMNYKKWNYKKIFSEKVFSLFKK